MTELSISILSHCAVNTVFRLNYLSNFFLEPIYSEMMRDVGMARSEFVVVFTLKQLETLTAQDICDITGRPKNSISQAVTKLDARKLIRKGVDESDARRTLLSLTAAGLAMYERVIKPFERREEAMLSVLTAKERAQFSALLGKLTMRDDDWATGTR